MIVFITLYALFILGVWFISGWIHNHKKVPPGYSLFTADGKWAWRKNGEPKMYGCIFKSRGQAIASIRRDIQFAIEDQQNKNREWKRAN